MLRCRGCIPSLSISLKNVRPKHFDQTIPFFSNRQLDLAMEELSHMEDVPPLHVYLSILKACQTEKSLFHVKFIQSHLSSHKVDISGFLGDYLVVSLAKCGAIEDALFLSRGLSYRSVFSWTAIITSCTECGRYQDALALHRSMLDDLVEPDNFTYVSLFQACGNLYDVEEGRKLHGNACKKGYVSLSFVGNSLVSMYGKCGCVEESENVFTGLVERNIVSWNSMLVVYNEQNKTIKALRLYRQMQEEGLMSNQATFVISLQICGNLVEKQDLPNALDIGWALYSKARKNGFCSDLPISNAFLSMCSKCDTLSETENVFSCLFQHDIISWNTMISAYVEQGKGVKALQLYTKIYAISNELTLVMLLMACVIVADEQETSIQNTKMIIFEIGQAIHRDACINGFASDTMFGTSLVTFYGKCGMIDEAEDVFTRLPQQHNIVSWNTMLSAYVEQGQGARALQLYRQMHEEGVKTDVLSFTIALRACTLLVITALEIGEGLHSDARKKCFDSDIFLGNALIHMYTKFGVIAAAENVFYQLSECGELSLAAMLSAYAELHEGEKALLLYNYVRDNKPLPLSDTALISILKACSQEGSLELCKYLHFLIIFACFNPNRVLLDSTLICAYRGCASIIDAEAVFDGLQNPDIVAWNACIDGYGGQGNSLSSLGTIDKLQHEGVNPNKATFTSALSAFSHGGLVNQGVQCIITMKQQYGVNPDLKHYSSMIDLLGRAGDFKRLISLLSHIQLFGYVKADATLWLCVLGACRIHGNHELGNLAFNNVLKLQPNDPAAYILMSNMV